MTPEEYVEMTRKTATYPKDRAMEYLRLGLIGEVGEVAELLKREVRGDGLPPNELRARLVSELGDVLWYIVRSMDELGPKYGADRIADAFRQPVMERGSFSVLRRLDEVLSGNVESWKCLCLTLDIEPQEVMDHNAAKLLGRLERGTLHGTGEDR